MEIRPVAGGRIPSLEGVRGLAILLVLAFHARAVYSSTAEIPYPLYRLLELGWSGVDLFLVLSGFLITGILLDSRQSPSYFRTFYMRRILRIFPLVFTYLFFVLVVVRFAWRWYSGIDLWSEVNPWWYIGYLANWSPGNGFHDIFLGHLWSLAIEEQFYLIWPLVIWLSPRRVLPWICLALMATAFALRCTMGAWEYHAETIYRLTPTRMDELACGALIAVGVRRYPDICKACVKPLTAVLTILMINLSIFTDAGVWQNGLIRTVGPAVVMLLSGCLVYRAAMTTGGRLHSFLCWKPLQRIGKYSFAMYVLHIMPHELSFPWVRNSLAGQPQVLVIVVKALYLPALVGLSFALAWVSGRVLEEPFLRLKSFFPYEEPVRKLDPVPAGELIPAGR